MDIRKINGRRIEAAKLAACAAIGAAGGGLMIRNAQGSDGIAIGILAGLAFYGVYRLAARFMGRPAASGSDRP
jgi:hypothetical protein